MKLLNKLGIGLLLASVVTLAANPAYANRGKGQGGNPNSSNEQTADTQESNTDAQLIFSDCALNGFAGCKELNTNQDFLNGDVMTVNQAGGFFDFDDWNFGGKLGTSEGGSDYINAGTGIDDTKGTWNLSEVMEDTWGDVMLVFKGGNTNLIGYKLEDGVTSGDWDSPFFNGDNRKDVSHISVYFRYGQNTQEPPKVKVPEPTSILGLAAVSALAASSLKRKRKSSNIELS